MSPKVTRKYIQLFSTQLKGWSNKETIKFHSKDIAGIYCVEGKCVSFSVKGYDNYKRPTGLHVLQTLNFKHSKDVKKFVRWVSINDNRCRDKN